MKLYGIFISLILAAATSSPSFSQNLQDAIKNACIDYEGFVAGIQSQGVATDNLLPNVKLLCSMQISPSNKAGFVGMKVDGFSYMGYGKAFVMEGGQAAEVPQRGEVQKKPGTSCCTTCACPWWDGFQYSIDLGSLYSKYGAQIESDPGSFFDSGQFVLPQTSIIPIK